MTTNSLTKVRSGSGRAIVAAASAIALALALSACSSAAGQAAGDASSAEGKAGLERANEAIASRLERPVSIPDLDPPIPVTEPLNTLPTGKKFVFVQCGVPECAFLAKQAAAAAAAVGAELTTILAGNDAKSIAEAFQSALDAKPDVILEAALDPSTWTSQLAAIKEAGIPVVAWTIPDEPLADGITASFNGSSTFANTGRLMANYVISDTEGTANTVIFYSPEYTVFKALAEAYADEIKTNCPGCVVDVQAAPASEIGSKLPARIVSYLQAHPKVDYVAGMFGSALIGLPQALKAAGIGENVKTISQAGGQINYQYLKDGDQTVDLSNDLSQESWVGVDMAARLTTGQELDPSSIGARTAQKFLVQDEITFDPAVGYESFPGYEDHFKHLWGVSQ